ncbi:hypothetical protein GPX91_08950, partial [Streptococcus thermophilus]|nr:hypothetical protein [Streptococcus thermophilus]
MFEKQAKVQAQKAEVESQLAEVQMRLANEQEARNQLTQGKKKAEQEIGGLKKDLEDLDLAIQKAEEDKATKDQQIQTLNEEIAHQE